MYRELEKPDEVESFYVKEILYNGEKSSIVGFKISKKNGMIVYLQKYNKNRETMVTAMDLLLKGRYNDEPVGVKLC